MYFVRRDTSSTKTVYFEFEDEVIYFRSSQKPEIVLIIRPTLIQHAFIFTPQHEDSYTWKKYDMQGKMVFLPMEL